MDLLNEIQSYIKTELNETFDYTLELTPDGRYGAISNGTINGMLGQLYNRVNNSFKKILHQSLTNYYSIVG